MGVNQINKMNDLSGRCLTSGFFFYSFQNGKIKSFSELCKSIVEGNQFTGLEIMQLRFSVVL